jgi:hypothetical protein
LTNLLLLHIGLAGVVRWLAAASTVQQPTALGYQPYELRLQLAAAANACMHMQVHAHAGF